MQALKRAAAATFATAALITAMVLPGSAAQAGSGTKVAPGSHAPNATVHGCPAGYVCIYPGAGWNNDRPSLKFYTYGAHNLSNQFGNKYILNNQTGGAIARICDGYNGTNCWFTIYAGEAWNINFTPVNSVYLAP